jgi:hypothetical protein
MKEIKKNLFITFTPYQFISAYNLCKENYQADEFVNIIYFFKSNKSGYEISLKFEDFNGEIIRFDDESWLDLIMSLKDQVFCRFFFFQENSIYNKYLAYHLKKKGTIICLGPDGTKPYGIFNKKHEIISILKDTWRDYKLLKSNGLMLNVLMWSKYYRYGSFKYLDEVWLQYPELFDAKKNKTKGKIVKLPELNSENITKLSKAFKFDCKLNEKERIILYFNQPFFSVPLIDKEFEILEEISNSFPHKKINIKLHPGTNPSVKDKMLGKSYLNVIEDKMPAEFYLKEVSNSIVLTGWSAALMHDINKNNNNYFYLYPLYKKTNDKVLSQISLIGFPHVKMLDNIKELHFM